MLPFAVMALAATGLTLADFFIKKSAMAGVSIAALLLFGWPLTTASLMLVAHLRGGIRHHLYPHAPKQLLVRSLLLLVMSVLNITSLSLNPYAQHAMLFQLSPIFALLIGVLFLGERLTGHVALVLLACLAGTWLILDPGLAGISAALLFAAGGALSNAVTNTYVAVNREAATPIGFTFWAVNGVALLAALYWLGFDRGVPAPGAQIWIQLSALLAVVGITLAGLAMQLARGNIGRVSIMLYVQMPVALALGWLAFGERPPQLAVLGGAMIVVAGASIPLLREKQREMADG
ncbi:DMT family transporter [Pukyongiella litopenaei]|uniref:DMT family transporter n=1 Tax=Pukyongiella litopenaei TaxID=2605946 RepID=A0A2S0MMP1_9RHOB|nr:DMT family transporter [Pukyongiella litopenaei]AVO37152.2 DMT family transporter [Pukyongiella litopenaei]